MESSIWIATVASIWIQCSSGASYAFGIYSSVLKSSQGYDQSTLDTVSVFKDIGANVGVLSGLLYTAVSAPRSRRRSPISVGPWLVHVAGAIQCFAGYFFIWLAVIGAVHTPPVSVMCIFMLIAAHAQTFFNTANVVTAVRNFPDYGGTIVGIMKGFLGLSGAVLIQVYQSLFKGNPSIFILMLALLPTLVSLLFMCLVRTYEIRSLHDKKHLNGLSVVALVVAAYLMILIILENVFTLPFWVRVLTFVVLLLLLVSPLRIAIQAQREDSWRLSQTLSTERSPLIDDPESTESKKFSEAEVPTHYHDRPADSSHEKATSSDTMLQIGGEMTLLQAMSTINFWLLFVAMVCGMGSGLATINNISQIGESLGYKTVEKNTLVSLWSIWNFLGRFGAGYLSDIFLHKKGWARPLLMAITLATMTAGHIVIASGFSGNLYVGSVLVGVCYGSQWSLMPTITSEIFGVLHMGTIFNTIAIGSPVGSYILSVRVIGYIYDKEASGKGNSCYGTHCFMLSFFILASVSFFGFLVALILFFRTRRFYTMVVLERIRHSAGHSEGNT
ncbi:protein NUCLEAR FUSION DEFECTIVE 4-like [Cornus florida]|uniref:protein NUCLEAR FUSION DEFECTIVE 4-like n=1 Tax=Cornus florida TaxID=4283 RepID=UPI00289A44F1|nr:protein NUCLEAR FUSION DEFECTIVE 4-like [Cornus florida]